MSVSRRTFLKLATMAAGAAFLPSWIREPAHAYTIPTGYIVTTDGKQPTPSGWLPCEGQRVSRRAYPKLYEVIGSTYGDLDLSRRTFALPDMRARIHLPSPSGEWGYIPTTAWIKT